MDEIMVSERTGGADKGTVNVRMSEQCQNEMSEEKASVYAVCQNVRMKIITSYILSKKFLMTDSKKENI